MKKKTSEPWVIENLKAFGNSLVPNEVIEDYGIDASERMIERVFGHKVRIEERHPMVEKSNGGNIEYVRRDKPIFIAEVTND